MIYEKKKEIHEKYLKEAPGCILGTVKRVLNLCDRTGNEMLEELQDQHDTALAYWRQNHRQYPPERVWDNFHFNLLYKSF
jgi:predicted transcriptional regulator